MSQGCPAHLTARSGGTASTGRPTPVNTQHRGEDKAAGIGLDYWNTSTTTPSEAAVQTGRGIPYLTLIRAPRPRYHSPQQRIHLGAVASSAFMTAGEAAEYLKLGCLDDGAPTWPPANTPAQLAAGATGRAIVRRLAYRCIQPATVGHLRTSARPPPSCRIDLRELAAGNSSLYRQAFGWD